MVKIVADSTCDLSKDLIEKYEINILPLHILLGEKEYEDGVDMCPEEIYRWSDENKTTPKTSAPSIERAMEVIKPLTDQGAEVICFSISGQMSTSGNVMKLAAEELDVMDRVSVIDSANLSTGIGLLVVEAAIMTKDHASRAEIVERIETLKPLVRASFVVDTLTYLYRGGRCSGLAALAGGALKLHPKISVINGKMEPGTKYRGSINKAVLHYVEDLDEEIAKAKKDRVFITHSGCDEEVISAVKKHLEELHIFEEILITRAGGVISSHCGPGTLGVLFIVES